MTVTNTTVKERFACDGSITDFAIPFDFTDEEEITVYLRDEDLDPITETLLVEGDAADYGQNRDCLRE